MTDQTNNTASTNEACDKHDAARIEHQRVIWASRRGMLELDLVLELYAKQAYPNLSRSEQQLFCRLLECQDQELFDWFLKKQPAGDADLQFAVDTILAYKKQSMA